MGYKEPVYTFKDGDLLTNSREFAVLVDNYWHTFFVNNYCNFSIFYIIKYGGLPPYFYFINFPLIISFLFIVHEITSKFVLSTSI
jgi:hypothetical protein